jgi:hypothetical protein
MTQNKNANIGISKLIMWILIFLVIVLGVSALIGLGIPDWLKNLFPNFFPPNNSTNYDYALECPVQVIKIVKGENDQEIHMCRDPPACNSLSRTSLYMEDEKIKVNWGGRDREIGRVFRSSLLIFPEVVEGIGSESKPNLFFELQKAGKLPEYFDLLNMHLAYFFTQTQVCRDFYVDENEYRKIKATRSISIPTEFISSGKLYLNADEVIKNKAVSDSNLYLDEKLTKPAQSKLDKDWGIIVRPEEGQNIEGAYYTNANPIEKSPEHLLVGKMENGQKTNLIKLQNPIQNQYGQLGFDSSGDDLEYVLFLKARDRVFIQLADTDGFDYYSEWILVEYWDAYRSFARVPNWAKL